MLHRCGIDYKTKYQRLASRIGGGFAPHPDLNHYDPLTDQVELPHSRDYQHKAQALVDLWTRQAECAGLQPSLEFSYTLAEGNLHNPLSEPADGERYFYHSDHLGSSAFITTENGYATQFLAYMPFGETLNEEQNSSNYYSPFKFSAKEKDVETGYSYFGARYYSPELSVWLSVDPLSDKYPSLSAYNYCAWNPVMLVDPDGRSFGDFISETGKLLGNDGILDGKVYVLKTTQTSADVNNRHENPNTSFSGITTSERNATESFIKQNSGNTAAFQENNIAYKNSVEIVGDPKIRQGMVDIVNQDNGKGSANNPTNNQEFGGNISNGSIISATPSAVGNVKIGNGVLSINLLSNSPSFHSHASGTYSPLPDFNSNGQAIETRFWFQSPSPTDIRNAGSRTNYVFGRGFGTVYIYNSEGVQATIPQKYFVNPR